MGPHGHATLEVAADNHPVGFIDEVYFYVKIVVYDIARRCNKYGRKTNKKNSSLAQNRPPILGWANQKNPRHVLSYGDNQEIGPADKPQKTKHYVFYG